MFVGEQCGKAEEAIRFYISLFKNSAIQEIERFKQGEPDGNQGEVKLARFVLDGQQYMANDSPAAHQFTFTPAFSIFVNCENEAEIEALFEKLGEEGEVMMPLADYGFSPKSGWVADRYGVSWQLNLAG